jgi:hypothetical protein
VADETSVTTIERPGPRSASTDRHVSHPSWCDHARCDPGPGLDASHRTGARRLIPARHWENEISVSCEHDEGRQDTCVELQVAHTRAGRSRGDDPDAVTSLVRLSHVEALQVAAALIAHAHRAALDFSGCSITE